MDDARGMKPSHSMPARGNRRAFLKSLSALPLLGLAPHAGMAMPVNQMPFLDGRKSVNALLISSTTLKGRGSLEHAAEALRDLYGETKRILLINFASLPDDRDAYADRMQRDFSRIDPSFKVDSLHQVEPGAAANAVREADAFFVSGGNTFLLLRELYDRYAVSQLRERVLSGAPYAGSSAGSNIAGTCIGTTNDFPITDVPTRRSLGLFDGVYNPHHPEETEPDFGSRQWKIRNYARYNPNETIVGVPNAGMLRINGEAVTLLGEGVVAFVQRGDLATRVGPGDSVF